MQQKHQMYEREVAYCRLCYRTFSCKGNLEYHKNIVHTVPNILDTREEEECEADPKEEDVDESDGEGIETQTAESKDFSNTSEQNKARRGSYFRETKRRKIEEKPTLGKRQRCRV